MSFKLMFRDKLSYLSVFFVLLFFYSGLSRGSDGFNQYDYDVLQKGLYEYEVDAHSSNLMGDKLDKRNGSLIFENIDIDIPGNSELEVQLRRRVNTVFSGRQQHSEEFQHRFKNAGLSSFIFDYGLVYFEIPKITMPNPVILAGWDAKKWLTENDHCTHEWFTEDEGGSGLPEYTLVVPEKANDKILRNIGSLPGSDSKFTTKKGWKINCTENEGFEVISTEGVKYIFEEFQFLWDPVSHLVEPSGSISSRSYEFNIYVTRVEDRFGNWVKYNYDGGVLKEIVSNDGRRISISKTSDGAIVTANGKVWKYEKHGTKIIRPDGKVWEFNWFKNQNDIVPLDLDKGIGIKRYSTPGTSFGLWEGNTSECALSSYSNYIEVKHPDGAVGKFLIGESIQGDTNVGHKLEYKDYEYVPPRCVSQPSLISKTIKYTKKESYTWHYEYSNNWGRYYRDVINNAGMTFNMNDDQQSIDLPEHYYLPSGLSRTHIKTIKTKKPDNSYVIEYIDRNMRSKTYEKIMASAFFDSKGKLLKEEKYEYDVGPPFGVEFANVGYTFSQLVKFQKNFALKSKKETTFDSNGNIDAVYTQSYDNMNEYNLYTELHEYNSINENERFYKYTYVSDTENWVLNKLSSVKVSANGSDYTEVERTIFHGKSGAYKGLPSCRYVHGQLISCIHSYWTGNDYAGKPRKIIEDVNHQRWIEYSNYKRGIPQVIKKPSQANSNPITAYISVDNNGWIESHTDFEGNCTKYSYNPMGLKTLIDYCSGVWDDINIEYGISNGSEGLKYIDSGMFKQIVSQGNYRKTTYFDSMLRPRLVKEWDSNKEDETVRYTRIGFNFENKPQYESKPHATSNTPYGITSFYDALGRIQSVNDNTLDGRIEYTYLDNNQIKHKDNKGNVTITSYLAYGTPDKTHITKIESPEGLETEFKYNLFNNVTQIKQGSLIEYRAYNPSQKLCKTVRSDIGARAYGYNSYGELAWEGSGESVNHDPLQCDDNVSENEKILYKYNNWGLIHKKIYGDNTPEKTFIYDNNSNVKNIVSGDVEQSYSYDSVNILRRESLSVDDKKFDLYYDYNSNQTLRGITYPNGQKVYFINNALGQQTKVGSRSKPGSYATNVKYHTNGTVKSFQYGNGFVHNTVLNSDGSGLPEYVSEQKDSIIAFDHTLSFDSNKNLESLTDNLNSVYNLDLQYDGLDRLETILDSAKGSGYLDYDEMGNIEYYKLGNQSIDYHYDTQKRLDQTSGSYTTDFTYDSRGNVINNGRNQSMTYNLAQQLTGSSSNGKNLSFVYDGNDKRIIKSVDGKKTYFIYGHNGKLLHTVKEDGTAVNHVYLAGQIIAKVEGWEPPPPPVYADLDVGFEYDIPLEQGCPVETSFRYDEYCIDFTKDEPIENYQPDLYEDSDRVIKTSFDTENAKSCLIWVKKFTSDITKTTLFMYIDDIKKSEGIYVPYNDPVIINGQEYFIDSPKYLINFHCEGVEGFEAIERSWIIENGTARELYDA